MPIGLKFPFEETTEGGVFKSVKTTQDNIKSKLLFLLTTKRNQRPMRKDFFSPLYDYIFEQWDDIAEDKLRGELTEKIGVYITEVAVDSINFQFDEDTHLLTVQVIYNILELGNVSDSVGISVQLQNAA